LWATIIAIGWFL